MEKNINEGSQNIVYFSNKPTLSSNGLYIVLAGETYPSSDYHMFRTERSGIFWGGIYVFEYIISGKGYIECDGVRYNVEKGDFVFMNAKRNIEYYADENDPYQKIWINFTGPFAQGITDGLSLDRSVYILKLDAQRQLLSIHAALSKMTQENKDYTLDKIALEFCSLFLKLNNSCKKESNDADFVKLSTAEKIKQYIDSMVIPNINLDDLSRDFSLEKGYIIHRFTHKYGISPYKYINQKKIDCAKVMLFEKKMKISEIANALGYSGTQHFSSSFKNAVGETPREYVQSRYK